MDREGLVAEKDGRKLGIPIGFVGKKVKIAKHVNGIFDRTILMTESFKTTIVLLGGNNIAAKERPFGKLGVGRQGTQRKCLMLVVPP